jgi:hypothetical protein
MATEKIRIGDYVGAEEISIGSYIIRRLEEQGIQVRSRIFLTSIPGL